MRTQFIQSSPARASSHATTSLNLMMVEMTKIAKNTKKSPPNPDSKTGDDAGEGSKDGATVSSVFKSRPEGAEDAGPPDIGSDLQDFGQEAPYLPSLDELGEDDNVNPKTWYHPDGLTPEDVDLLDTTLDALEYGVPRTVKLSTGAQTYMRLADLTRLEGAQNSAGAELSERRDQRVWRQKADTVLKLEGPSTEHGIDELASGLFAKALNCTGSVGGSNSQVG